MATSQSAPSFDEIIQAGNKSSRNRCPTPALTSGVDRQRRKNEQLANEIFGKNRRPSGPGYIAKRNTQAPTLASRIGIAKVQGEKICKRIRLTIPRKRSSSTSVPASRANPFNQTKPPSRPSSAAAQHARVDRLTSAVNNTSQANVLPSSQARTVPSGPGLSIKGTAGPFVVQASNFAPGTTAADIEAAIQTVAIDSTGNSGLMTCRILTSNPTVMAEMVFPERYIADKVVGTFNNQKADGRILHVYHKQGSPSPALVRKKSEPVFADSTATPVASSKDLFDTDVNQNDDVEMSTDTTYSDARQLADQDRRSREDRRADPEIQDGRYGFSNTQEPDRVSEKPREALLPRDEPHQRRDDRPTTQRRDEPRERGYDSPYGDSREDRGRYRREARHAGYRRDFQPSYYGNGAGGRGYRASGDGYGRMYSEHMVRGAPRGSRGGDGGGGGGPSGGYR
jgi:hypothetical protein